MPTNINECILKYDIDPTSKNILRIRAIRSFKLCTFLKFLALQMKVICYLDLGKTLIVRYGFGNFLASEFLKK